MKRRDVQGIASSVVMLASCASAPHVAWMWETAGMGFALSPSHEENPEEFLQLQRFLDDLTMAAATVAPPSRLCAFCFPIEAGQSFHTAIPLSFSFAVALSPIDNIESSCSPILESHDLLMAENILAFLVIRACRTPTVVGLLAVAAF